MHRELAVDGADIVRGADHAGGASDSDAVQTAARDVARLPDFEIELRSPK
jgi:hypothetical protein